LGVASWIAASDAYQTEIVELRQRLYRLGFRTWATGVGSPLTADGPRAGTSDC
jgi:hypothetical protein